MYGEVIGFEITTNWEASDKMQISANYSWKDAEFNDVLSAWHESDSPKNMANLRANYNVNESLSLNTALYYYDGMKRQFPDHTDDPVSAFVRTDLGITWKGIDERFEISLWGQNIFDESHREFAPDHYTSEGVAEIERSFYAEFTWRF